jgi:hypothetical protein
MVTATEYLFGGCWRERNEIDSKMDSRRISWHSNRILAGEMMMARAKINGDGANKIEESMKTEV